MNNQRRKKLEEAYELVGKAKEIVSQVQEEEQESYENLPDNFRNGERGEEMKGCLEMLQESYNYLDDAGSVIEQI